MEQISGKSPVLQGLAIEIFAGQKVDHEPPIFQNFVEYKNYVFE